MTNDDRDPARHEQWRQTYRKGRYLEHLNVEALHQRLADCVTNTLHLTAQGKIGISPSSHSIFNWWETFTHVHEEMNLRGLTFPADLFTRASVPKPTQPASPRAVQALSSVTLPASPYLVKYGSQVHLADLYTNGRLRLSPASSYGDPSLGPARHDDELARRLPLDPRQLQMTHVKTGKDIHPVGPVQFTISAETDYYVLCLSRIVELRLFDDFSSDACLIIREPDTFAAKIFEAFHRSQGPWLGSGSAVDYFDPVRPNGREPSVFLSKHFRFEYQWEFRFVWLPPTPVPKLSPIFLELGNLSGISDLVQLPTR